MTEPLTAIFFGHGNPHKCRDNRYADSFLRKVAVKTLISLAHVSA